MSAMFKLREPTVAVHIPSSESLTIFTVPRGAIKPMGEPEKSGLVEAVWNGRRIAVFLQDIESRGAAIQVASAGR
jgi:hypothetical protein